MNAASGGAQAREESDRCVCHFCQRFFYTDALQATPVVIGSVGIGKTRGFGGAVVSLRNLPSVVIDPLKLTAPVLDRPVWGVTPSGMRWHLMRSS